MMKLSEIKYERPSVAAACAELRELTARFAAAPDAAAAIALAEEVNRVRDRAGCMAALARYRCDCDVRDGFYLAERDWWDEQTPVMDGASAAFQRAYVASAFVKELDARFGAATSGVYAALASTYSNEVLPLLQEENALVSRYERIIASAEVEFEGETHTVDDFWLLMESADRDRRRSAAAAFFGFYEANSGEIEGLYDSLVKLRARIAAALGFPSFVELGYARLCRAFTPEAAARFREAVHTFVCPLAAKQSARQAARIGVDKPKHYDIYFAFPGGNPAPRGTLEEQLELAGRMYHELSPETGEFIDAMFEREAYDLPSRRGKTASAYCELLPEYRWPFVFANSNGGSEDIGTLTHELGHAFQLFRTVKKPVMPECVFPANDACEIHSTAMEYLTWPWMELFFGRDTRKLEFMQLSGGLSALPYQSAVDEFQTEVYTRTDMTPAERRELWRRLDEKYQPWLDYSESPFLASGGYWMRQGHIFSSPFYYLDYSIAFVCAFRFWTLSRVDAADAFSRYLKICDMGGRGTLYDIVAAAGIGSPFDDGVIRDAAEQAEEWLDSVGEDELK